MLEILMLSWFDLHGNIVRLQKYSPCMAKTHLFYIGTVAPKGLYSTHSYSYKERICNDKCLYLWEDYCSRIRRNKRNSLKLIALSATCSFHPFFPFFYQHSFPHFETHIERTWPQKYYVNNSSFFCCLVEFGLSCKMFALVIEIKMRNSYLFFYTFDFIITFNWKVISTQWYKWDSGMCTQVKANWRRLSIKKSKYAVY